MGVGECRHDTGRSRWQETGEVGGVRGGSAGKAHEGTHEDLILAAYLRHLRPASRSICHVRTYYEVHYKAAFHRYS